MKSLKHNNERLLLVVNPVAGKGRGKSILFELVSRFTEYGYTVTVIPTCPDGKTEIAVREVAKDYDIIVAVGGDGTLNNVINGIIKSGSGTPLGYIPLGSTNDYASSLGLNRNIKDACDAIANGTPKEIDVGAYGDDYFVYIACTGLFAETSYMTSQQLKNALGHNAYVIKGLMSLKDTRKLYYVIHADDERIEGDFLFVSFSNTLSAGGIIKFSDDIVKFDDGYFELSIVRAPKNIAETTALINGLMKSRFDADVFVQKRAKRLVIECETATGWSLDGENGGIHETICLSVKEKAIKLIY